MNTNKLNLCLLLITIFTLISCGSNSTDSTNTFRITGKVTDLLTNQPINGVTIRITPQSQSVLTNSEGAFHLNVEPGTYQITADKDGYTSSNIQIAVDKDVSVSFQMFDINSNSGLIGYYPLNNSAKDESQYKNHGQFFKTNSAMNRKNDTNAAMFFDNMAMISIPHAPHLVFDSLTSLYSGALRLRNSIPVGLVDTRLRG
ncbi:MAG: carboxypeptidase regulatory-like domain-containing protein [Armatimonadetes bacterium]|nr:carboxypeptidase regulatory-like domain-containing protein [Armatimonadota bacterium]